MSTSAESDTNSDDADEVVSVEEEVGPSGFKGIYDFVMQVYCWFSISLILYVLSAGPAFRSYRDAVETGTNPLLQILYLPLSAMCSQSETLDTVVRWYVGFWT